MEVKKNPEANLEKKRFAFLGIGLLVTFAIVLSSFEYQIFTKTIEAAQNIDEDLLEEEVVRDIPPPPPAPPPPPPPVVTEIEVVEDDKEIETVVSVKTEETEKEVVIVDIVAPKEEPVVETIFDVVEEQASFPGGMSSLYEFIQKNVKYPPMARESGVQGKVFVEFVVWKDGSIRDIKIKRGVSPELDEEAIRVVKSMPKWEPGKQRGKAVNSRFVLPINFKLG